jgi:hypothetical protein
VSQPAVIGFAPDVSPEAIEKMTDEAIAADDFEATWTEVTAWAERSGIATQRVEAAPFTIATARGRIRVAERGFGYVLVDGEGRHQLVRGVMTDGDLKATACAFLQRPALCAE